jgi:ferrochelatase
MMQDSEPHDVFDLSDRGSAKCHGFVRGIGPTAIGQYADAVASDPKVGVLLLQLGTPDAADTPSLRRYLRQFLRDRRVVDLNRAVWLPLLEGVILRTRPARSAALYRKVWQPGGSPLAVISEQQAKGVAARLSAAHGDRFDVRVAMRYGNPSIASVLAAFAEAGIDRLLAFPMYPQYASATTGSSVEELFKQLAPKRVIPSLRVVAPYYDDPAYVGAVAAVANETLAGHEPVDRIILSFHGLPKRYVTLGDPYAAQCEATARAIVAAAGWDPARVTQTFQSRFGREEWLQPYTDVTLNALGAAHARVAVACPGFTADCLETIEEIGMTGREQFIEHGGKDFIRIPCVNDDARWLDAMAAIASRNLGGWAETSVNCDL